MTDTIENFYKIALSMSLILFKKKVIYTVYCFNVSDKGTGNIPVVQVVLTLWSTEKHTQGIS